MRVLLALVLLSAAFARGDMQLSAGLGVEARVANDISPQNSSTQGIGQIYASMAFHPWSLLWELGRFAGQSSSNGNYSVATETYSSMFWGRYEPMSYFKWSPYAGIGLGQEFAKVTTQFGTAHDERWADGGLAAGLCGGVMTSLWKHWNLEGELQVLKLEFANNMGFGFTARTGYTF